MHAHTIMVVDGGFNDKLTTEKFCAHLTYMRLTKATISSNFQILSY